jgi:N6-L-threonylcarbamoyladenine synthase
LLPKLHVIPSGVEESPGITKDEFQRGSSTSLRSARDDKLLADLCASFQQAIIDVLVTKTIAAARKHRVDLVTISGGVSCNEELRRQMRDASSRKGIEFKSAEPWLCTDNAAMIAFAALLRLRAGFESQVTEEIDPNLALAL